MGDDVIVLWEKEVFEKVMKGNEQEDFYQEYNKQREIGFDAYQNQVKNEIKSIETSEELHFLITDYNYDAGEFLLEEVVSHPFCDIKTAKMIYWLSEPIYLYEKFGTLENCTQDDYLNYAGVKLLMKIEEKAKSKSFKEMLKVRQDIDVKEMIEETDFTIEPYIHIPKELRK